MRFYRYGLNLLHRTARMEKKGSNNTSSPNHTRERIVEDFAPEEFHQLLDQIAETEEERAHSPNPQKEKNQGPNQGPEKNH